MPRDENRTQANRTEQDQCTLFVLTVKRGSGVLSIVAGCVRFATGGQKALRIHLVA